MYYYRITKYDPKLRDMDGCYIRDEWTEFGDVGIKKCTLEEYEAMEAFYIDAVMKFAVCLNIEGLQCFGVEKHDEPDEMDMPSAWRALYNKVTLGATVVIADLPILLKLILRNYLWCKLGCDERMFVHFGYDYYMFVGLEKECKDAVENIERGELFVEEFKSPYLENKNEPIAS